jgi:hypothetical protein
VTDKSDAGETYSSAFDTNIFIIILIDVDVRILTP